MADEAFDQTDDEGWEVSAEEKRREERSCKEEMRGESLRSW